jgi:hypothetical protein
VLPASSHTPPHTLSVGELLVRPGDVRLGHDRKRVLLTEGGRTRTVGTTSEVLSIETERGVSRLRRVQTLDSRELGMLRAEVLMSPSTFAPFRSQSAGLLGDSTLAYHEGEVRGSVADRDGSATAVAHVLDRPVFDAYAVEVILRTLPLEMGYEIEIPAYVHRARGVVPVAVRVESLESCAEERAWRVAVDFGALRSTYWIGAESRLFLRQDIPLSSGATLSFRS